MDNIWDRKSFEVGGHWPLWRGWKKRMTAQNRQKSNAKKKEEKKVLKRSLYIDNLDIPRSSGNWRSTSFCRGTFLSQSWCSSKCFCTFFCSTADSRLCTRTQSFCKSLLFLDLLVWFEIFVWMISWPNIWKWRQCYFNCRKDTWTSLHEL